VPNDAADSFTETLRFTYWQTMPMDKFEKWVVPGGIRMVTFLTSTSVDNRWVPAVKIYIGEKI
jgi:hypothetical protein